MASDAALKRCVDPKPVPAPLAKDCDGGINAGKNPRNLVLRVPYEAYKDPVIIASPNDLSSTHFNWRGLRNDCSPTAVKNGKSNETCLFRAKAVWWAECPKKAATCPTAYRIYVLPQLIALPVPKNNKRSVDKIDFQPFPNDKQIAEEIERSKAGKPLMYAASVLTADIRGEIFSQKCGNGMVVKGTTENGSLDCDCDHGWRRRQNPVTKKDEVDEATGWPICDPVAFCKPPKILLGIDEKGDARCAEPDENNYICDDTRKISSNGSVSCNAGSRMRQLKVNKDCYVVPKDAPLKQQYVDCGDMQITCCRLKKQ
jgi:hypothetical protein